MIPVLLIILVLIISVVSTTWSCDFYNSSMVQWARERLSLLGTMYNSSDHPCSELSFGFQNSVYHDQHSPRIFTFHNDEMELISDWLQYYSFMFGFRNINFIDHMSQEPAICRLLSMYLQCGVNITTYGGHFDSYGKSYQLSQVMRSAVKELRFLIPVDVDEFVTLSEVHEQQYDTLDILQLRHNLLRRFNELPVDGRKYKFTMRNVVMSLEQCDSFSSDPKEVIRRVLIDGYIPRDLDSNNIMAKTFYYSEGFLWTDQGHHRGRVHHDLQFSHASKRVEELHQRYILSNISLYHFNAPSYTGYIKKIVRGVKAYGLESMTNCTRVINGHHYCSAFIDHFDKEKMVCSRDAYIGMTGCGIKMGRTYRNDRFKSIFTIHAKTMAQLVGPEF
jgi:hypothetical protein